MIASLAFALSFLAGCGGESQNGTTGETSRDHAAEAEREITEENMDRHLEALEAEIAADEAAQD